MSKKQAGIRGRHGGRTYDVCGANGGGGPGDCGDGTVEHEDGVRDHDNDAQHVVGGDGAVA